MQLTQLAKDPVFLIFSLIMGILVLTCIFPPDFVWAKKLSDFTVHIMIGFLILGLAFLLLDQRNLMFASFAYCGLLCLFLKGTVNQGIKLATNSGAPSIEIVHINLASANLNYEQLIDFVRERNADIISFNEVTPDWEYYLDKDLTKTHPYSAKIVRIDPFGLAFFSTIPIDRVDTIMVYGGGRPHLEVEMKLGLGSDLTLINSYFLAPLTRKTYGDYRVELTQLGQRVSEIKGAVIAIGDYNMSDWSNELREYKSLSGLISSRRDVSPGSNTGVKSLLNFPNDHMLFNDRLECVEFSTLNDSLGQHLGIRGQYQIKAQSNTTARR